MKKRDKRIHEERQLDRGTEYIETLDIYGQRGRERKNLIVWRFWRGSEGDRNRKRERQIDRGIERKRERERKRVDHCVMMRECECECTRERERDRRRKQFYSFLN